MTLNKYIYLFNLVNNQEHALISVFGSLLVHFLSGFGVTFARLAWCRTVFLGARVSGYCCNVCSALPTEFITSSTVQIYDHSLYTLVVYFVVCGRTILLSFT